MFAVENGNERARCNYGVYLMGLVVIDLKGKHSAAVLSPLKKTSNCLLIHDSRAHSSRAPSKPKFKTDISAPHQHNVHASP